MKAEARRTGKGLPKAPAWTETELAVLRGMYREAGPTATARALGRSVGATYMKACRLGLADRRGWGTRWTQSMLRLLREGFPSRVNAELAAELGVSPRSLSRKAAELGLRKDAAAWAARSGAAVAARRAASVAAASSSTRFAKGVRSNPAGEFGPGRRPTAEELRKAKETLLGTYYSEAVRVKWGLPQRTRLRIAPRLAACPALALKGWGAWR